METVSKSLQETQGVAESLALFVQKITSRDTALILALEGDLGSGKTTFTQFFAYALGIKKNLTSPTFVIEKKYPITHQHNQFDTLIHIDAYRLNSGEDLRVLGFKELSLDPHTIIILEWPERVVDILPTDRINFSFQYIDEGIRKISSNMKL